VSAHEAEGFPSLAGIVLNGGLQPHPAIDKLVKGLKHAVIASIGPTTSGTLRDFGINVDMEPSHPKMGFLVKEAGEQSARLLAKKA